MVFAWQVLLSETRAWNRCGSFGAYNGKWGPFIPRDIRQNMKNLDKYNQDKAVAFEPKNRRRRINGLMQWCCEGIYKGQSICSTTSISTCHYGSPRKFSLCVIS